MCYNNLSGIRLELKERYYTSLIISANSEKVLSEEYYYWLKNIVKLRSNTIKNYLSAIRVSSVLSKNQGIYNSSIFLIKELSVFDFVYEKLANTIFVAKGHRYTNNKLASLKKYRKFLELYEYIFINSTNSVSGDEEEEIGYPEGRIAFRIHRTIERDPEVIRKAKEKFSKEHGGHLFCEVCEFDFSEVYGSRGDDCIEGHHTRKVSEMKEGEETKVDDIALVCSNCHWMIHRKPHLSVNELKELVKSKIKN